MENFYQHADYRKVILHELTTRTRRNPRYSQSAFARDIGIASNRLSEILGRKQGLSRRSAIKVAERLELSETEREYFCDLVDAEHARSAAQRQSARLQVVSKQKNLSGSKNDKSKSKHVSLPILPPKLVMSWYHLTIVEFVRVSKKLSAAEWYSQKLDISLSAAKIALQELKDHNLVSYDSHAECWNATNHASTVDIPAKEIKAFHEQMVALAIKSLFNSGVEEREFNSMILPMRQDKFSQFKLKLRALVNEFADEADGIADPDLICGFSSQLFQIAKLDADLK
jgi:uncharacterized protein (TIGR02147 family)